MADASYTYVYYFVPQDGDTEDHPNVFLVRKPPSEVTRADIEQLFPLPGKYFFRFKMAFSKSYVWRDGCGADARRAAPQYQGKIVCKVSRLALTSVPQAATGAAVAAAPRVAAPAAAPVPASASAAPVAAGGGRGRPAAEAGRSSVAAAAPAAAPSTVTTGRVESSRPRTEARRATVAGVPQPARAVPDDLLGLFAMNDATSTPAPTSFSPRGPAGSDAGSVHSAGGLGPMGAMGGMGAPSGGMSGGSRTPPLGGSIGALAIGIAGRKSPAPSGGTAKKATSNFLTGDMWK